MNEVDFDLLRKAASVTDEDGLSVFGEQIGFPSHLGLLDTELDRIWLWEFPEYWVATFDEGNCQCHVVYAQRKGIKIIPRKEELVGSASH
jgi:hypothetical protein